MPSFIKLKILALLVHAGSLRVSIIHRTLTWTTGSFTCVRSAYMRAFTHGGWAHRRVSTTILTRKNSCSGQDSNPRPFDPNLTLYQLSHPVTPYGPAQGLGTPVCQRRHTHTNARTHTHKRAHTHTNACTHTHTNARTHTHTTGVQGLDGSLTSCTTFVIKTGTEIPPLPYVCIRTHKDVRAVKIL